MNGLWLNARDLVSFALPVPHTLDLRGADESWRISVEKNGQIVLRYVDGHSETFMLRPGDEIVAIGDHIYASLQVPPGTPEGALQEDAGETQSAS